MPVELTILSGAREGACVRLDSDAFRVGDDPAAEVYFDPRRDPAGRGRVALIRREESGWRIQNAGSGPVLLNHSMIDGRAPLRSGDIIRLSDMGPDVRFNLVSTARTGAAAAAGESDSAPAQDDAAPAGAAVGGERPPHGVPWRWCAAAAAALALLIAAFVGVRNVLKAPSDTARSAPEPPGKFVASPDKPADIPVRPERADKPADVPVRPEQADKPADAPIPPTQPDKPSDLPVPPKQPGKPPEVPIPPEQPKATAPPTIAAQPDVKLDPWKSVAAAVAPAVCLLVVETPEKSKSFPVGTACAIREDALLTNAMVAAELQSKRLQGWHVTAFWPADSRELPVDKILVHRTFNGAAESPAERIYWELAVLRLQGKHAAVVPLAEPQELAELEEGLELVCAGIAHDGLRRTRLDKPQVEQHRVKVFLRTRLAAGDSGEARGAPALLHLTGTLPKNLYGSPLVNAAGRVVGVYAEKAQLTEADAKAGFELHYAPLITLARVWLAGNSPNDWIEPECPKNETPAPSRP